MGASGAGQCGGVSRRYQGPPHQRELLHWQQSDHARDELQSGDLFDGGKLAADITDTDVYGNNTHGLPRWRNTPGSTIGEIGPATNTTGFSNCPSPTIPVRPIPAFSPIARAPETCGRIDHRQPLQLLTERRSPSP